MPKRLLKKSLLTRKQIKRLFPKTMLSKRIEDGEQVDVAEIFKGLQEMVREVLAEHYPGA